PFAPKPSSKRSFKPPTLPLLPLSGSPERQLCSLARDWKNYMLQSHIIYYTISYYIHIHTHTHARMHAYTHTHTHTHTQLQNRHITMAMQGCHLPFERTDREDNAHTTTHNTHTHTNRQ